MNSSLQYRMYSLVLYQLSPIQAGIQSGHSNDQFGNNFQYQKDVYDKYLQWRDKDMTVIVLSAGSSFGLTEAMTKLDENGIDYAAFREPDLWNQITSISFLVDERAWPGYNENFPDDPEYYGILSQMKRIEGQKQRLKYLGKEAELLVLEETEKELMINSIPIFERWNEYLTPKNAVLREFLKKYKLA